MMKLLTDIQNALMVAGVSAVCAVSAAFVLLSILAAIRDVSRNLPGKAACLAFLVSSAILMIFGGGKISFPRTNPDYELLADDGTSHVSNTVVRVGYTRHRILPDSADLNIWNIPAASTNDADWTEVLSTTVGASPSPIVISYPNATNYRWMVYTTWQPAPAVQTNGVLHALWTGTNRAGRVFGVPVRSVVKEDGTIIAPPNKEIEE